MDASPLLSSKKCPHCQQWSRWQQHAADRCEHCGELLNPQANQEAHEHAERAQQTAKSFHLDLKPEDGVGMRLLKRLLYGGQLLFAAIMAFLVYLAVAIAS